MSVATKNKKVISQIIYNSQRQQCHQSYAEITSSPRIIHRVTVVTACDICELF